MLKSGIILGKKRVKPQMNNSVFPSVSQVKISLDLAGSHVTGCQRKRALHEGKTDPA